MFLAAFFYSTTVFDRGGIVLNKSGENILIAWKEEETDKVKTKIVSKSDIESTTWEAVRKNSLPALKVLINNADKLGHGKEEVKEIISKVFLSCISEDMSAETSPYVENSFKLLGRWLKESPKDFTDQYTAKFAKKINDKLKEEITKVNGLNIKKEKGVVGIIGVVGTDAFAERLKLAISSGIIGTHPTMHWLQEAEKVLEKWIISRKIIEFVNFAEDLANRGLFEKRNSRRFHDVVVNLYEKAGSDRMYDLKEIKAKKVALELNNYNMQNEINGLIELEVIDYTTALRLIGIQVERGVISDFKPKPKYKEPKASTLADAVRKGDIGAINRFSKRE